MFRGNAEYPVSEHCHLNPDTGGRNAGNCVLRLEAAVKTEDEKYWYVTFSYPRQEERVEPFYREFRTIKVRSADGELMGARNGTFLPDAA